MPDCDKPKKDSDWEPLGPLSEETREFLIHYAKHILPRLTEESERAIQAKERLIAEHQRRQRRGWLAAFLGL